MLSARCHQFAEAQFQALAQPQQGLIGRVALPSGEGVDLLEAQAGLFRDRPLGHPCAFGDTKLVSLARAPRGRGCVGLDLLWGGMAVSLTHPARKELGDILPYRALRTIVSTQFAENFLSERAAKITRLYVLGRAIRELREQRRARARSRRPPASKRRIQALEAGQLDPDYELLLALAEAARRSPRRACHPRGTARGGGPGASTGRWSLGEVPDGTGVRPRTRPSVGCAALCSH